MILLQLQRKLLTRKYYRPAWNVAQMTTAFSICMSAYGANEMSVELVSIGLTPSKI